MLRIPHCLDNRLTVNCEILATCSSTYSPVRTSQEAHSVSQNKAVPVTGLGSLYGCDMLRIPHCIDNRLTDGDKIVIPTHRPHFTPQKHYYFSVSGTHFCYRLSKPQVLVRPVGLGKFKNSPHRVWNPRPSGL
jgi:hypothetical protein